MEVEIMVIQARMESPTNYYHVMMGGNKGESVFRDESQKIL